MNVEKKDHKFWYNKKELIDFYIFLAFTLIFFMRLKFGVNYDGWRQIYFLYPFIVLIALSSQSFSSEHKMNHHGMKVEKDNKKSSGIERVLHYKWRKFQAG